MVRVLVVDSSAAVQRAVVQLLADVPGLVCLPGVSDSDGAIRSASEHRPEVVVIDPALRGGDGFGISKWIRAVLPHTGIIFFTTLCGPAVRQRATDIGVEDVIGKDGSPAELVRTIRRAAEAARAT